jgi:hypothetical protein
MLCGSGSRSVKEKCCGSCDSVSTTLHSTVLVKKLLTLDSMTILPTPQRNLPLKRAVSSTTRASGNMFTQEPSCSRSGSSSSIMPRVKFSVADPDRNRDPDPSDPYVFGSHGSGTGSFYHQAKIVRKASIPTVCRFLLFVASF